MRDECRPTESLREEHHDVRTRIHDIREEVGRIPQADAASRKAAMGRLVEFLRRDVAPHAAWEERTLYSMVDRFRPCGAEPFTASMRHEHTIVRRWIDELAHEAARPEPDARAFVRRADNLFGLIEAHMEEEEEVLLPVLDRFMTADEIRREIGKSAEYR